MTKRQESLRAEKMRTAIIAAVAAFFVVGAGMALALRLNTVTYHSGSASATTSATAAEGAIAAHAPQFDVAAYENSLRYNSHLPLGASLYTYIATSTVGTTTVSKTKNRIWPVKTVYPNYGALLPSHRIVAYYGNFYSKGMGVLGQTDASTTKQKLLAEVKKWDAADPQTPVIPAVDYIALTAQLDAGFDGKYRARMPDKEIDKAVAMARSINGIVILDIQVGQSNLQTELPLLRKYLVMPDVHLAIDPEFAMTAPQRPGKKTGTFDATDINYAANFLAKLVKENNLPPKILVVHRFTEEMVTRTKSITPLPEVQVVMDMDGWGTPEKKLGTYQRVINMEPVQFSGFKLFYKNDILPPSTRMLSPKEILDLTPSPVFIQYQ